MAGIRIILQPRDRMMLSALDTFRVLDREQAAALGGFGSVSRGNARLLALTRAGYLSRSFIGTIQGGRRAIYRRRDDRARWSEAFARHQLHTNALHLALRFGPLPPGVSFEGWRRFARPVAAQIPLVPDGFAAVAAAGERLGYFIEVDQGTETRGVWKEKARCYVQLARSGSFEAEFRISRFRVLVIAPSDRRARSIQAAIGAITSKLFFITSIDIIKRDGLFALCWLRPGGTERQSLLGGVSCGTAVPATGSTPASPRSALTVGTASTISDALPDTGTPAARGSAPSADRTI